MPKKYKQYYQTGGKAKKSNWWQRFKKRYTDYGTQQKQMGLQATGTPKEKAAATKYFDKGAIKKNPTNVAVQKAGAKKGYKVTPGTTPKKMIPTKGAGAEAEYPKFEKGTYRVKGFKTAFREARKAGKTEFSWAPEGGKSRRYSTKMK